MPNVKDILKDETDPEIFLTVLAKTFVLWREENKVSWSISEVRG